ncbi:hypothetical protein [Streptomyces geranii]|nr:hypothetical protein [Streptomyces geranii]
MMTWHAELLNGSDEITMHKSTQSRLECTDSQPKRRRHAPLVSAL